MRHPRLWPAVTAVVAALGAVLVVALVLAFSAPAAPAPTPEPGPGTATTTAETGLPAAKPASLTI